MDRLLLGRVGRPGVVMAAIPTTIDKVHAVRTLLVPLLLALPLQAHADAMGPPPATDGKLAAQIERLAATISREAGREPPRLDARLSQAAADLLRVTPGEDAPPAGEIISEALNLRGIVEPSPQLILSRYGAGDDKGLLQELRRPLSESLQQGQWRRLGVAVSDEARPRVMIALLESFVRLDAVPRSVPMTGTSPPALELRGRVLPPYQEPQVLTTAPDGKVERLPVQQTDGRFTAKLSCISKGRYQIEVIGDDRYGATVLANFPIYCGVAPPQELAAVHKVADRPFRDAADAERQILGLLNEDRARFGLPALLWEGRLADVARAHSQDMRENNFLGHISPRTGSAGDRVMRAGIETTVLLENLARAYSPQEAERGLMNSPGHRANLLSRSTTHAGVGVALGPPRDGARELFVTQLFSRAVPPFDAQQAPKDALARVLELRSQAKLSPLRTDAAMTELARKAAEVLASGELTEDRVGSIVQNALPALPQRYRSLRTVVVMTSDLARMNPSKALLDPAMAFIGVGTMPVRQQRGEARRLAPAIYVVMVLGSDAQP